MPRSMTRIACTGDERGRADVQAQDEKPGHLRGSFSGRTSALQAESGGFDSLAPYRANVAQSAGGTRLKIGE